MAVKSMRPQSSRLIVSASLAYFHYCISLASTDRPRLLACQAHNRARPGLYRVPGYKTMERYSRETFGLESAQKTALIVLRMGASRSSVHIDSAELTATSPTATPWRPLTGNTDRQASMPMRRRWAYFSLDPAAARHNHTITTCFETAPSRLKSGQAHRDNRCIQRRCLL